MKTALGTSDRPRSRSRRAREVLAERLITHQPRGCAGDRTESRHADVPQVQEHGAGEPTTRARRLAPRPKGGGSGVATRNRRAKSEGKARREHGYFAVGLC